MCSIEEAWAGQTFSGKPVSSQADLHKAYMSLPDDNTNRNNQLFNVSNPNEPQPRGLSRGVNSKYSREPRVSNISRNSSNGNINFSSTMPTSNGYNGVEPRPAYMQVYDNAAASDSYNAMIPMPVQSQSKDAFSDIGSAFSVSDTVQNFMNRNDNSNSSNQLLNEYNPEEINIINTKIALKRNEADNVSEFTNVKSNRSNNSDTNSINDIQIQMMLQQILSKLDNLEREMHHNKSRNMHDIILYILIGMLIAFILYSIFTSMK